MLNQPIFQITLPLIVTFVATIWAASWSQNKRTEDIRESLDQRIEDIRESLNQRAGEINKRLDNILEHLKQIERKLENHAERITKLEVARWQ